MDVYFVHGAGEGMRFRRLGGAVGHVYMNVRSLPYFTEQYAAPAPGANSAIREQEGSWYGMWDLEGMMDGFETVAEGNVEVCRHYLRVPSSSSYYWDRGEETARVSTAPSLSQRLVNPSRRR